MFFYRIHVSTIKNIISCSNIDFRFSLKSHLWHDSWPTHHEMTSTCGDYLLLWLIIRLTDELHCDTVHNLPIHLIVERKQPDILKRPQVRYELRVEKKALTTTGTRNVAIMFFFFLSVMHLKLLCRVLKDSKRASGSLCSHSCPGVDLQLTFQWLSITK